MVKVELKGVYRVRSKGRTYYYAWRGKGAPRLPGAPGDPEFHRAYSEALAQRKRGDETKIAGLCALWRESERWKLPREQGGMADTTKRQWRPWLDRIQEYFGTLSVRQFDRPEIRQDIKRWRDKWRRTPRTADMGKQVLSALLSFAVDEGRLGTNPCEGIKNLYSSNRSDQIWTPEQLDALAKVVSKEVAWAARLAALTGLRRSDLFRLSWSHVGPLAIELRTGKSGGRKTTLIPIYAELRELLDEIPKRATTVLTNTYGQPWTANGFGSSWNRGLHDAKLADADLHFHDLRGTAATRMYVGGIKYPEIAEIMAWSEKEVERLIDRYVKKDELLRDRIRRMDEARPV